MKFKKEEVEFIINNWQQMTASQIGVQLNRSEESIQGKIHRLNIKKQNIRKYNVNENYFDKLNCSKAYWLGFIAADGNIRKNFLQLSIGLAEKDLNHLIKFKNDINFEGRLTRHITKPKNKKFLKNEYVSYRITICSKKMCKKIVKYNIPPNKSLILDIPKINKKYYLSFIQGIIDGDGTIYTDKKNRLQFSIVGTEKILNWISKIFNCLDKRKNPSKPYKRKNHYVYKVSGQRAVNILKKIFNNKIPYLSRKWSLLG